MSKAFEFKIDVKGFNELAKSEAMVSHLRDAASQVASAAGPGFNSDVHQGSWVAIGTVYPETPEAVNATYDDNKLLTALGASGLELKR